MNEHTKLPWKVGAAASVWRSPYIDEQGNIIHQPVADFGAPAALSSEERRANAKFCALAANYHAKLVEGLREAVEIAEGTRIGGTWDDLLKYRSLLSELDREAANAR